MSCVRSSKVIAVGFALAASLLGMAACSTNGEAVDIEPVQEGFGPAGNGGSDDSDDGGKDDGGKGSDSADVNPADSTETDSLEIDKVRLFRDSTDGLEFVYIPSVVFKRSSIKYSISSYYIATKEVTQDLYKDVVGQLPDQDKLDDDLPVVNVSWYDAVLFCNALSKKVGLDTVYVYKSVGDKNFLEDLEIDYSVEAIRLPTEMEWEIAAHGGVMETTYYWGYEPASDYAYYGQSKGPAKVASKKPNAYGLYDMAGNVAEWVNDWYASYSTADAKNPVGPTTGKTKCIRGGGWGDKVANIAPKERDKKDPLYSGRTLGFRIAYSKGF